MNIESVLLKLGVALGLGLLVGLQRERTASRVAGFRTFPLITVLGALCALVAQSFGSGIVAVGLAALAAIVVIGNFALIKGGENDPGLTTEAAMLVMYCVGAYLVAGHMAVAIVVGAGVAVLLHLKPQMHTLARALGDRDFKAIMQFVVVTLVILPVLPNRTYGPCQVLNPFHLWLMVVLVVGISLGGYLIYKCFGDKAGTLVGGVLGGMISSTATTASYARRSHETPAQRGLAAVAIILASTVVFARVLLIIGVSGHALFPSAAGPIGAMLAVFALLSVAGWFLGPGQTAPMPEQENPSELRIALAFGILYAVVLLAVAAAEDRFGQSGLYAAAALSGLTDMDAITLSVTQLVNDGKLVADAGWRAILIASLSNLVFKAGAAALLGGWRLFARVALLFGAGFAAGIAIIVFWPG